VGPQNLYTFSGYSNYGSKAWFNSVQVQYYI